MPAAASLTDQRAGKDAMSLSLLLPETGVADLLTSWPDEPRVYQRDTTELDRTVTSASLDDYVATGCVPASEIAVVKAPGRIRGFATTGISRWR